MLHALFSFFSPKRTFCVTLQKSGRRNSFEIRTRRLTPQDIINVAQNILPEARGREIHYQAAKIDASNSIQRHPR